MFQTQDMNIQQVQKGYFIKEKHLSSKARNSNQGKNNSPSNLQGVMT
jgi:hypothetical protein